MTCGQCRYFKSCNEQIEVTEDINACKDFEPIETCEGCIHDGWCMKGDNKAKCDHYDKDGE